MSKDMLKQIFPICFKTVKDNDLVWVQYRVLYKVLGTNELLFKIKSHYDANAVFANITHKTILHLLVQCENVKRFWSEFKTHIQLVLGCELTIDPLQYDIGKPLKYQYDSN